MDPFLAIQHVMQLEARTHIMSSSVLNNSTTQYCFCKMWLELILVCFFLLLILQALECRDKEWADHTTAKILLPLNMGNISSSLKANLFGNGAFGFHFLCWILCQSSISDSSCSFYHSRQERAYLILLTFIPLLHFLSTNQSLKSHLNVQTTL